MLDFRFLIGVLLAGIVFALLALRAFGPVDPLFAAIAEKPELETKVAARNVLSAGFIRASNAATAPPSLPVIASPASPPPRPVLLETAPLTSEQLETAPPTSEQLETEEEAAKPRRRSIPRKKQSEEDLNPVLLFFSKHAKVK